MLTWIKANTLARKAAVFTVVFVVAAFMMGTASLRGDHAAESEAVRIGAAQAAPGLAIEPVSNEAAPEAALMLLDALPFSAVEEEIISGEDEVLPEEDGDIPEEGPAAEDQEQPSGESAPPAPVYPSDPAPVLKIVPPPDWNGAVSEDFHYLPELPLSEDLQRYTWSVCEEQGLSYTLVLALMWRESNFLPHAVGHNTNGTKDSGIMQINDVNRSWLHKELDIDNLLDPYQNIKAGCEILGRFLEKHGEHGALLAYQYGEAGMRRKLEQGMVSNRQIEKLYEKQAEFDAMLENAVN